MRAFDCPHCGDGTIVFGPDYIEPCEFCEATNVSH